MGGHGLSLRTCRERRGQELDTAKEPQKEQTGLSWSQGKRGRGRERRKEGREKDMGERPRRH